MYLTRLCNFQLCSSTNFSVEDASCGSYLPISAVSLFQHQFWCFTLIDLYSLQKEKNKILYSLRHSFRETLLVWASARPSRSTTPHRCIVAARSGQLIWLGLAFKVTTAYLIEDRSPNNPHCQVKRPVARIITNHLSCIASVESRFFRTKKMPIGSTRDAKIFIRRFAWPGRLMEADSLLSSGGPFLSVLSTCTCTEP